MKYLILSVLFLAACGRHSHFTKKPDDITETVKYEKDRITTIYELPDVSHECRTLPNGYSVRYLVARVDIYSNPDCTWDDTLLGKVQCDNLVTDEPREGDNGNDFCSVYIPDQGRLFQYSIIYNDVNMKLVEVEILDFKHIEL